MGSSPHTRGALQLGLGRRGRGRIIPAYAGSTDHPPTGPGPRSDHPRIRGEHKDEEKTATIESGSSPHTRGALPGGGVLVDFPGIIPAYAGSTRLQNCADPAPPDHPRIRGEHFFPAFLARSPSGSSPHTRGARRRRAPPRPAAGIIPAYAGSTPRASVLSVELTDHPRIRGEHVDPGPESR